MNLLEIGSLTEQQARAQLEKIRWPDGPMCPFCQSKSVTKLGGEAAKRGVYKCKTKECRKQFTVFKGSIFEDSHLTCKMWLMACHLMCSSKKGFSANQMSRELGITVKSAWFMVHRIREAMKQAPLANMLGDKNTPVEVDETYMHTDGPHREPKTQFRRKRGRGTDKTCIVALVERNGRMRAKPIEQVTSENLKAVINESVRKEATLFTDELLAYTKIGKEYAGHETVCHSEKEYARDDVHVNTAEWFFGLLKRGVHGTFHHISRHHLPRYLDEFSFRWSLRRTDDGERTEEAIRSGVGKRLQYRESLKKSG